MAGPDLSQYSDEELKRIAGIPSGGSPAGYRGAPDLPLEEPGAPFWKAAEFLFGKTPAEQMTSAALAIPTGGSSFLARLGGNVTKGAAGGAIGAALGNEESVAKGATKGGEAGAAGTVASAGLDWLLKNLSRARLPGGLNPLAGTKASDAAQVAEALGQAAPDLRPPTPTAAGLTETTVGGAGKAALGASRERTVGQLGDALTTRAKGEGYDVLAGDFKAKLEQLVKELADAGRAAYSQNQGKLRDTGGALATLRSRADILKDIEGLLGPELFAQFQGSQKTYGAGKELLRLFEPQGKVPNSYPLGPGGLNLEEVQRRTLTRLAPLRQMLGDDAFNQLIQVLFRGAAPPAMDKPLVNIPVSRLKGVGLRAGTLLAGPGRPGLQEPNTSPFLSPLMPARMQGLSQLLGLE